MMYVEEKNSFEFVKSISLQLVPEVVALKMRYEGDILVVMTQDMVLEFLNDVAANFISKIDGVKNLEEISKLLLDEYHVGKKQLQNDLIILAREFQLKRIIILNRCNK